MAISLVFVGSPSYGQSPSCYDPMEVPGTCLPWGYTDLQQQMGSHIATDISKDGSAVATVNSPPGFGLARWRLDTGFNSYTPPAGFTNPFLNTEVPVLSEDGAFIAGRGVFSSAPAVGRIFRWEVATGSTVVLPIGPTPHPTVSNAQVRPERNAAISADGQTIVGRGSALTSSGTAFDAFWPFIWTSSGGTNGNPSQAFTGNFIPVVIDGFGSRVVGFERLSGIPGAVFWDPSGVGSSIGPNPESASRAISYDGQVIAGQRTVGGVERLFRWTQATGPEEIPHRLFPRSVSDDGLLISGWDEDTNLPTVWTSPDGYRSLAEHLDDFGISYTPTATVNPFAVASGDGSVFVVLGEKWVTNVRSLQAAVLGDSYSSGEGALRSNEGYLLGTDLGEQNRCHRAPAAYGVLMKPPTSYVSYQLLQATVGTDFTWAFIACSGARTYNVLSTGTPKYPAEQEQLDQGLVNADTDLVTITIGGNDSLFVRVMRHCATNALISNDENCLDDIVPGETQAWGDYIRNRIETQVKTQVASVLQEIVALTQGNATVVLMGYPFLVSDATDCAAPGFNNIGAPGISKDERIALRVLARHLNGQLAEAAAQAGVHFRPVFRAFEGHNVCDSASWLNGVVLGEDDAHWFHPNVKGQRTYAGELEELFREIGDVSYPRGFFESGMPRNPVAAP